MKTPRKTNAEREFGVIAKYFWHTLSCKTSGTLTALVVMHLLLKLCEVVGVNIVVMDLRHVMIRLVHQNEVCLTGILEDLMSDLRIKKCLKGVILCLIQTKLLV